MTIKEEEEADYGDEVDEEELKARKGVCKLLKITPVPEEEDREQWCQAAADATGKEALDKALAAQKPPLPKGASNKKSFKVSNDSWSKAVPIRRYDSVEKS